MTTPTNNSKESKERSRIARYLAAHAVLALRAGFRVERVALDAPSNAQGASPAIGSKREKHIGTTLN